MSIYSKIIGTGSYLPPNCVTNKELVEQLAAKGVETTEEWITSRSGIETRYFAEKDVNSSDLGVEAAKNALDMAGLQPNDVDLIIFATATPDHIGGFPSNATIAQRKLGIETTCAAFDMQAVCSGFVYSLSMADAFIKAGAYKNILIIGAEVYSRIIDFNDRTTCVLFGDGAGAVVVSASSEPGILASKMHANGAHTDILCLDAQLSEGGVEGTGFVYMDGQSVFRLAVSVLDQVGNEVLKMAGIPSSEVDWFIPHQANIRIMQSASRKVRVPLENVVVTVNQHGNTSAASIPLALDAANRDGRIQSGQTVLLAAIGAGLAWGAVLLRM